VIHKQISNLTSRETELIREQLSAAGDEKVVFALSHDQSGQADGIENPLHGRYRAEVESFAIHNQRIHLDLPGGV
jgi:hypothetical protein